MQGNIARIVAQFKQSWCQELEDEAIRVACREAGHSWRERELGPVTTVKMFLLQILFGNMSPRVMGVEGAVSLLFAPLDQALQLS